MVVEFERESKACREQIEAKAQLILEKSSNYILGQG